MASHHIDIIVPVEEKGLRLDLFLAGHRPELSRTFLRKVIDIGGVHVAGRRVRQCSGTVKEGDRVEVYLDGLPLEPFVLQDKHIVFRDQFVLAVNKPAGVDTQPTPARYKGTLYSALLNGLQDPFRPARPPDLGMVQRLDRDTSGVMVFSIHPSAHKGLTAAFSGRQVRKIYQALVVGQPESDQGEICSLLARGRNNLVKSVSRGGKEAITRFRILHRMPQASLLEIEILTGRSHQIRVHMAEAGHPLLGDRSYGGPKEIAGQSILRQMLHCCRLELTHPVTGQPLLLEAPVPNDFAALLQRLSA